MRIDRGIRRGVLLASVLGVGVAGTASAAPLGGWEPQSRGGDGAAEKLAAPELLSTYGGGGGGQGGGSGVFGDPGLGDPLFPLAGNGGYDVRHYALALAYDPA